MEAQKQIDDQVTTLQLSVIRFVIQSANSNFNNPSIASEPLNSGYLPSQPLSNPRRCIGTLFLCTNQEGREDALLHEEDIEILNHEEPKGIEIVYSASSEATPPELPSKSHFEWVNLSDLNFISPQHYGLLETDGQLRALCRVLDTKGMNSLVLDESRFITCGKSEFKTYSGHIQKLHNNRAKIRTLSMRKHLGPWQFQEKLVSSQNNGWTNRVWDPGKNFMNRHFWGVIVCIGAFRVLLNINWDPLGPTKFKHWWGFKDEFRHKPP
ncbi:hypothetical protein PIB30_094242 [Stylosanthes scabra]|uniref:Uncharacterized protein n=1 Tax=Stylosanthes scabra TaxID=79078 RepID=A0ABU6VYM6_9FABA|nr:hypothetical protein [Stylosanthes scabra]